MSYEITGVLKSIDPHTGESRGFIEIGADNKGDVHLRTVRSSTDHITRFRPETALQVAELMAKAAAGPPPPAEDVRHEARKMLAKHLLLARQLLDHAKGKATEQEATRAIASALANELRKGVSLAKNADRGNAILAALEDDEKDAGNGLGL